MGFAKKCIASFNRAVELEPDNVEYRKSRYEFYRAAPAMVGGGTDKAAAEIAEIEKRDPVQGAGIRADLLLKDGKTDEAFSVIESLRAKFPERQVSLFQLGRLAAMTGQHLDDGEKALRQYLHYSPQDSEPPLWSAHWRLAMILEKKGNVSDARTHYETTLQLNPCFTRARESLARLPLAAPSSLPGR
jgi:tetratricopeptide (TPR) repeat protein